MAFNYRTWAQSWGNSWANTWGYVDSPPEEEQSPAGGGTYPRYARGNLKSVESLKKRLEREKALKAILDGAFIENDAETKQGRKDIRAQVKKEAIAAPQVDLARIEWTVSELVKLYEQLLKVERQQQDEEDIAILLLSI